MTHSPESSDTNAAEDPPGRVGRLSLLTGSVSLHAPGQEDWAAATVNFPVTAGQALWTDPGAMAEIEVGSTAIRLGGATELEIGRLDDRRLEATLDQGEINIRLARLEPDEVFAVLTPRGAVRLQQPGRYHIDAGTTEAPTRVESFAGEAVISRDGSSLTVHRGEAGLVSGTDRFVFSTAQATPDALDEWAVSRDEGGPARAFSPPSWAAREPPYDSAPSMPPPVSPEMTGAADLARYGQWEEAPGYGAVWYPRAVPVGWAPYHHGDWAWVRPWGWTWIDDAPWGFAPFHYGRWAYIGSRWAWCPGSFAVRPVYAPALVAFRGAPLRAPGSPGRGPAAAWAPLGPGEAYVPWHRASAGYVRRVNETAALGAGHATSPPYEARTNRSFTTAPRDIFPTSRPAMPGTARPSHQAMALGTALPHLGSMPGRDPRAMGIPPRPQLPFVSPTPGHGWHSPPPEAARLEGRSRHSHEFREAPSHASGRRHDSGPAHLSVPRPAPPGPRHEGGHPGTAPHGREHGRSQPRPHDAH